MTELLLDIDFRQFGNSDAYVLDGWAEPEDTHRWSIGRTSRLRLPAGLAPDCVLVISATPYISPPELTGQVVMLAINGRLLATLHLKLLHAAAFRLSLLPGDNVLSLAHLSEASPRDPTHARDGANLGLALHNIRIFRLPPRPASASLQRAPVSLSDSALATHFESIGQGCQFGLMQRQFGAEPLGLLRFVDTTTAMLYEALCTGFAGIEKIDRLSLEVTDSQPPTFRWRQMDFDLAFDTCIAIDALAPDTLLKQQSQRLAFLRRKFFDDCTEAQKIFVLTRGDLLSEAEALAVFCALTLHGAATLLWTTFGTAGPVTELCPGFLRGELGDVDENRYATPASWLRVMRQAVAFCSGDDLTV